MGAVPTTENKLAAFADGFVKAGISGGEDALKAYILTTPAAFLEGPGIDVLTNEVISELGNALYKNAADLTNKIVIDLQTKYEALVAAYETDALKKALTEDDQNAIQNAREVFENGMASLIHSDGSAKP